VPLPDGLPVVDHHCHLSPHGEGVAAARRFRAAGGTHLFLATQNYTGSVARSLDDYAGQFETTIRLAARVRADAGVVAYPVVAPYPVDLVEQARTIGLAEAEALHRSALDLAGRAVAEGRAVAIGEVGRAHFPVNAAIAAALDRVLDHALAVARDARCPAILHSEDLDAAGYRELATRARGVGLRPERVVKHYARGRVPTPLRDGLVPSYLAARDLVDEVVGDPAPWFLETDFLDDPRRPGAVLDLATVPRRARAIVEGTPGGAERLVVPFVESIARVYGLDLEAPRERGP